MAHPTQVGESCSLARIEYPELVYALHPRVERHRALSDFQRTTVARACQALDEHGTFVLGDGTGVGKGRVIAGVAAEFWHRHKTRARVLWISANKGLGNEATRDLNALGLPRASSLREADGYAGVAYCTYGLLSVDDAGAQVEAARRWMRAPHRVVVLDEAHLLRRKCKASARVAELLAACEPCKVVYSSATLASQPSDLHLLRNICNPEVIRALSRGGNGAMELLASDFKSRGVAVSRQLDQSGCRVRCVEHALRGSQASLYDECAELLADSGVSGAVQQRFFMTLVAAFKVDTVLAIAREALRDGKSVVINVQYTGEAAATRAEESGVPVSSSMEDVLRRFCADEPRPRLPLDAIDSLFIGLGGRSEVCEITGRSRRTEALANGRLVRRAVPAIRDEIEDFQEGRRDVAIVSKAGNTGISLHNTKANGKPRVHVIAELPWSAQDFLQSCGRTHRTGSVHSVEYVIVHTALPIELRVGSAVYSRLSALGAITCGDRRACTRLIGNEFSVGLPIATRRALASHICLGRALRLAPDALDHEGAALPPHAALEALGFGPKTPLEVATCTVLEERDSASVRDVALLAALHGERGALWGGARWSGDADALPHALMLQVRAVRAAAATSSSRLGTLPDNLVEQICQAMVADVERIDLVALYDSLEGAFGSVLQVVHRPLSSILNRISALPLALQTEFLALIRAHSRASTARGGARALAEFVRAPSTRVERIVRAEGSDDDACARFEVTLAPEPPRVQAWRYRTGAAVLAVTECDAKVRLREPGASHATEVSREEWGLMQDRGDVVRGSAHETALLADKAGRAARRAAEKNSGVYVVATENALELWQDSRRVVISHEGVVGLLLRREPLTSGGGRAGTRHSTASGR